MSLKSFLTKQPKEYESKKHPCWSVTDFRENHGQVYFRVYVQIKIRKEFSLSSYCLASCSQDPQEDHRSIDHWSINSEIWGLLQALLGGSGLLSHL